MNQAVYPIAALGKIAEIVMGQSPPGSTYNESGIGLPFYQGVADFGDRYPSRRVYCSAPTRIAEKGDVLFSVRAPIGRINRSYEKCAVGRGLAIIRGKNSQDTTFLEFVLRTFSTFWQTLENEGSVFGNARREDLETLEIIWPDEPIRHSIAHILGTLDDKIELNRRMNDTLESIARPIFKSWFVDFDPVRAKSEGRDPGLPKEIADLFPDSFEDTVLGEIPSGWKVMPVGDALTAVGGGTPSTKEQRFWDGGNHHWATPKDMSSLSAPILFDTERKITEAGLLEISSGLLPAGTVLMSSRAPVGYLALAAVPTAINQGFIAMICDGPVSNFFALNWCYFNMDEIKQRASGTTFAEISKVAFRPISMVVPAEPVIHQFTDTVRPIYAKIQNNLEESRRLAVLRDTLLPKLISGELRVKDVERFIGRLI